ncbi:hypothetical protein A4X13_0g7135 [Tilletia indica]|uniref:Uncharacterized protein n=1 Tax=Tilletia indica TaxID=43049 RepID=A0A177TDK4_9BASI|nr:hypothetical protein A4X13_0g7135 [Tilletia indica]
MSTPTTFAVPRQYPASPSRISTAGLPPRSGPRRRNGLDPPQGRADQDPSNKSIIKINILELLVQDLYSKDKVDIETVQLEDCFSLLRAITAISPQARPTTVPPISSARMPSRALALIHIFAFLAHLNSTLRWVIEATATTTVAIAPNNGEGHTPDYIS